MCTSAFRLWSRTPFLRAQVCAVQQPQGAWESQDSSCVHESLRGSSIRPRQCHRPRTRLWDRGRIIGLQTSRKEEISVAAPRCQVYKERHSIQRRDAAPQAPLTHVSRSPGGKAMLLSKRRRLPSSLATVFRAYPRSQLVRAALRSFKVAIETNDGLPLARFVLIGR